MSAGKEWYYVNNEGQRRGPVELRRSDVYRGFLTLETLVWTVGMAEWLPAEQTELKALINSVEEPPPLPVAHPPEPPSDSPESEDEPTGVEQPVEGNRPVDVPSGPQHSLAPVDDLLAGYTGRYAGANGAGGFSKLRRDADSRAVRPNAAEAVQTSSRIGSQLSALVGWVVGLPLVVLGTLTVLLYGSQRGPDDAAVGGIGVVVGFVVLPPVTRRLRQSFAFMRPTIAPPLVALGILVALGGLLVTLEATGVSDLSPTSAQVDDSEMIELRDKVVWYCGKAMSTYMKYRGDSSLILSGDDLMTECREYATTLLEAAHRTSWSGCADAGDNYRKLAEVSRETAFRVNGYLEASAYSEFEREMKDWGEMVRTELRPFRKACRIPDDYDGFARQP